MPIKPRGERGNKWLRYFFAIVMLAVVVGGSAFLVTRFFGDDGDGGNGQDTKLAAVPTAQTTAGASGDEPTPTPEPEGDGPTPTPEQAEPTPTTQPAAAAQPTQQSQQAAPTSAAGDSTSEEQQSTSATAEELLPATDEIEGSWSIASEGERTREEVGAQLGDGGEQLLLDWRWRENQFRDFNRNDPDSFSDDATFLSVSVHRFASEEGAAEALVYLSDIVVSAQGLQEVADVGIGDVSRGLEGPGDGVNLYVLYVQDGNYLIRLGGSSTAGDPAPFVDSVARQIVEG